MVGQGPGEKEEVSVPPLLSVSAETPIFGGEVLLTFLHPFSEVTVAEECEKSSPVPHPNIALRAYTVIRLNNMSPADIMII